MKKLLVVAFALTGQSLIATIGSPINDSVIMRLTEIAKSGDEQMWHSETTYLSNQLVGLGETLRAHSKDEKFAALVQDILKDIRTFRVAAAAASEWFINYHSFMPDGTSQFGINPDFQNALNKSEEAIRFLKALNTRFEDLNQLL